MRATRTATCRRTTCSSHEGRVVVIDLPQIVDAVANPNGIALLHRDCVNIAEWFTRKRVEVDAEQLFAELLAELF